MDDGVEPGGETCVRSSASASRSARGKSKVAYPRAAALVSREDLLEGLLVAKVGLRGAGIQDLCFLEH